MSDVSEDPAASGQEVTTVFTSVTSQESLMESLGISASVDVRYGLFSGGAKFDFAQNHAVNSFSSFIAGRCQVLNAVRHGHGFTPTAAAAGLSAANRMDDFRAAFGNMFVRSLKTGGELNIVARITSVSEEDQTKLAAALHAEYNGLAAGGSFQAAFNDATKKTSGHTEVTVFMSQAGGVGAEATFTGPDATKIAQRLSDFPASVHDHPVGYEAELATYNTIPIVAPTAEQTADLQLVLQDCFNQKMGFLKALSDLDFALSDDAGKFFDNLPPQSELQQMQGEYRTALNALMSHAIAVSTGKMSPPQEFVANPAPPPLSLKKKPFVSGPPPMVTVPNWGDVEAMERGGGVPTADDLGLVVNEIDDEPVLDPDQRDRGEIVSMSPPAGTVVPRGSVITVHVRNS